MPEVDVKNLKNEIIEKLSLSDDVFAVDYNESLIWEAVQHHLASQRKGTVSTKTRAEVSGSGKFRFHYDEALGSGGGKNLVIASWKEI